MKMVYNDVVEWQWILQDSFPVIEKTEDTVITLWKSKFLSMLQKESYNVPLNLKRETENERIQTVEEVEATE